MSIIKKFLDRPIMPIVTYISFFLLVKYFSSVIPDFMFKSFILTFFFYIFAPLLFIKYSSYELASFNSKLNTEKLVNYILLGMITVLFLAVSYNILLNFIPIDPPGSVAGSAVGDSTENIYSISVLFFFIVILAPTLEELFFRGVVQDYFTQEYTFIFSIIITSLFFSLVHFNMYYGVGAILSLGMIFGYGLILGFTYEKTRTLIVPIIIHILINFSAFINFAF